MVVPRTDGDFHVVSRKSSVIREVWVGGDLVILLAPGRKSLVVSAISSSVPSSQVSLCTAATLTMASVGGSRRRTVTCTGNRSGTPQVNPIPPTPSGTHVGQILSAG